MRRTNSYYEEVAALKIFITNHTKNLTYGSKNDYP